MKQRITSLLFFLGALNCLAPARAWAEGIVPPGEQGAQIELRRLCDQVASGLRAADRAGRLEDSLHYLRFEIAPVENQGKRTEERQIGTIVTDYLSYCMVTIHRFTLIEAAQRARIRQILAERRILGDPEAQRLLASQVGANLLLTGRATDAGGHFLVSVRVTSVANGETIVDHVTRLPDRSMVDLSERLFERKSKAGAAFRSAVVPGWGQAYNDQPIESVAFITAAAGALGTALTLHLLGNRERAAYEQDRRATVSSREQAETYYTGRNIALYAAAGVWAINVLHAWLGGYEYNPDEVYESRVSLMPGEGALSAGWSGRF